MKKPDQLRRYWEGLGLRAAAVLGLVTIAWLSNFGEVRAQGQDDLCESALECSDEGDLAHVQNLEGIPLNAALLWQAGLEPPAAEAIASTLGTLNIKGGGWYYSWDQDHKYIMVGGQLIPAETFFGSLDAAAGYVAAPGQEVATTTARPEALPTPTVQQSTHEIENTASEELVVQETLNALEGLGKLLIVSVPVLTVLMALLIRGNKREEAIARIEAAAKSKKTKKNVAIISEEIRGRINGTPVAAKSADPVEEVNSREIVVTHASPLRTMVFDGVPLVYEQKKKPRHLILPTFAAPITPIISDIEYANYENPEIGIEIDIDGSKFLNDMPRRKLRMGEKLLRPDFLWVGGSCMYPWLKDNHYYLIAEMIRLETKLPLPGDLVRVKHRNSAIDTGIYAGINKDGSVNLLSINDTTDQPGGHKFIATLPKKNNDRLSFTVLASLDRDNKKSKELLVELLRQAWDIQDGVIDTR